jgi:hypothetical protein
MVQVQQLPYKAPRKLRRTEVNRFAVKWGVSDTIYFRWFKRDAPAVRFLNELSEQGINARIIMK